MDMDIYVDYIRLNEELNQYAVDAIYDIMERCGKYMTAEQIITYENKIAENKIVIANRYTEEDNIRFKGNIPVAHGPRAKKDGYIHVYPFKYKHADTDGIINNYINGGVILHELYHYIVKLDIKESTDKKRVKFGHYLTEGMVEFLTEEHSKNRYTRWGARRNVDAAQTLYEYLQEKNDIIMIFHNNFEEIFERYPDLEYLYKDYLKETSFINQLNELLNKICQTQKIDVKKILARFNRQSLKEGIESLCIESSKFLSEDLAEEFNMQITELYSRVFDKKEKSLN